MKKSILFVLLLLSFVTCKKDKDVRVNVAITPSDFLNSTKYNKLEIEILYVDGYAPQQNSIDHLKNFLEKRINKPGGISVILRNIPTSGKSLFSVSDITGLEKTHRRSYSTSNKLASSLLLLDGDYAGNSGNSKVLGIAYGPTSMAVFQKTIADHSDGIGEPSRHLLETTVMEHEFGHILGLVNNGIPVTSLHQDSHGKHCDNENCLMYYTAETTDILSFLLGGAIPGLDQACINDLRNAGGK